MGSWDQITERLATTALSGAMQVDVSSLSVNVKVTLAGMIICDGAVHEEHSNFRKGNGETYSFIAHHFPFLNSGRHYPSFCL